MPAPTNTFKKALNAGDTLIGCWLSLANSFSTEAMGDLPSGAGNADPDAGARHASGGGGHCTSSTMSFQPSTRRWRLSAAHCAS